MTEVRYKIALKCNIRVLFINDFYTSREGRLGHDRESCSDGQGKESHGLIGVKIADIHRPSDLYNVRGHGVLSDGDTGVEGGWTLSRSILLSFKPKPLD